VEGVIGAGEFLLSDEDASRIESFIATMYA